jgi:hypothetical protein
MALRRGAKSIPSLLREIAFRALQNCAPRRCQRRRSALSVIAMDAIIEYRGFIMYWQNRQVTD